MIDQAVLRANAMLDDLLEGRRGTHVRSCDVETRLAYLLLVAKTRRDIMTAIWDD